MPRVKLGAPKKDYVMALILERKHALELTDADLGRALGVSRQTASRLMSKSSDCWELGQLKALCRRLGIPIEELREAIRMN